MNRAPTPLTACSPRPFFAVASLLGGLCGAAATTVAPAVAGSGSYGSLVVVSANRRKSLSDITLPELDPAAARGYQGHDRFAVLQARLRRRFPIYREGDTNAAPSGGVREIRYRLQAGGGLVAEGRAGPRAAAWRIAGRCERRRLVALPAA